jgi:hypothetical protein
MTTDRLCSCGAPIGRYNQSGLCRACVRLRAAAAGAAITRKPPRYCSVCGTRIARENLTGCCRLHRYPLPKRRYRKNKEPNPYYFLGKFLTPETLAEYTRLRQRYGYTRNEALRLINRPDLIFLKES